MIIKFVVNNHDFIRESNKALLLRVGLYNYVWVPCSLIEPYTLVQQSKLIIPDDMRFTLYKGDLKTLWKLENKDKITPFLEISTSELKERYYRYQNMSI